MKKTIFVIIAMLLCLPLLSTNAASAGIQISSEQKTVTSKDEVNMKLSILNSELASGQFYVTYDTNYYSFSCDDITYKQNVTSNEIDCSESNGKIIIIYVDEDAGDSQINPGEFLNLLFKVKTTVTTKTTTTFALSCDGFSVVTDGKIENLVTPDGAGTFTIYIEPDKDDDIYLKTLEIKGYTINFSKNKYEYSIDVENAVAEITISASANSSTSSVAGTGNKSLQVGDNKFTLTVTAEDGSKQNYVINVKRKSATTTADQEIDSSDDKSNINEENKNTSSNDKQQGTVESPPTGVYSYVILFSIIIMMFVLIYKLIIKKNVFPKV